jgi:ABC-2 type transport system permease protein
LARLFVRLKLRLQHNTAVAFGGAWLVPLAWVGGLALGLAGAWLLAGVRGLGPDAGGPFLVVACNLVLVTWVAAPLLAGAGGGDQLIDLHVLAPLPLSDRDRITGLLAAAFVGVMPAATLLGLSGAAVGYGTSPAAVAIAIVAAVVLTVMAVVASRAAATGAGRLLRSRRGRDVGVALLALVAGGLFAVTARFRQGRDELIRLAPSRIVDVLAWSPPGAVGRAVLYARDGRLGGSVALLAYGTLATLALGAAWAWALRGAATAAPTPASSRRRRSRRDGLVMFSGPLALLPPTTTSAVAAKELRYALGREPRQLQQLVVGGVIALLTLVATLTGDDDVLKAYTPAMLVFFLGAQTATGLLAVDADANTAYVLTGAQWRQVLLGKQLAVAGILGPACMVLTAVAVIEHAAAVEAGGGLLCGAALFAAYMAVGAPLSVRRAYPMPTSATAGNPTMSLVPAVGGMAAMLVLAVPVLGPAIASRAWLGTNLPGAVVGLLVGLGLWAVALRWSARWAERHEPELIARLHLT